MGESGGADATMEGSSARSLAVALQAAARRCGTAAKGATVLYSGGLDSSLVAFLLKPVVRVRLMVIGTESSKDPAAARAGAELLGLPLREVRVARPDVDEALTRFATEFAVLREPLRSVNVALAIAFAQAEDPVVAVGQGADELFFGYAHFRGLRPEEARNRGQQDWSTLEVHEWPRALRMAGSFGLELQSIFMDPEVVRIAATLAPPAPGEPPKVELRRAAQYLGLPEPLVHAPKRAFQYGSGIRRLVSRGEGAPSGTPLRPSSG